MARNHDGDPTTGDSRTERILVFRIEERHYAIRVSEIAGLVSCEALRAIPGAPAGVLGLAEWRGSILTVIDLPRYLNCPTQETAACLVRLAPPLEQTALYVPASVQMTENPLERSSAGAADGADPGWRCGDEPVSLVDPREIVQRVELEMREGN